MAKKRKGKLKVQLSKPDNNNVVQISAHSLPTYHHFVDAPDQKFRLFFEEPKSSNEIKDPKRPNKKFMRKPSGHNPFRIMSEGKTLVGEDIAKTFAILLSKFILNNSVSDMNDPCAKEHTAIKSFFGFLSTLGKAPTMFSEINVLHVAGWLGSITPGSIGTLKYVLSSLLSLHPEAKYLILSGIITKPKATPRGRFEQLDYDEIVSDKDYSERIHFQIMAYVFFEIENGIDRLITLEEASPKTLGEDYIHPEEFNTKNPIIRRLLESGEEGFKKLKYHLLLLLEHPSIVEQRKLAPKASEQGRNFTKRLGAVCRTLYKNSENPAENYDRYKSFILSSDQNNFGLYPGAVSPTYSYLNLSSKHHEVAILIYALITLGVNKEVALSWKWKVNGIPWYENYDVELGINNKSNARDKKVVLVGVKKKGKIPKVIKKSISINSPLFMYLKFLDRTRPKDREHIFVFGNLTAYMTAFVRHYPVINDDGNRLTSLETKRFRKSYLGHKTMSLLKGVKNSNDLVVNLREALNHKSFDTTFSSYLMKSGMARNVIDSSIVALTSTMLESAMSFNGEIKEDHERSEDNDSVFLCDCSDPLNPSHGLPIAERCTKYDMCLGCSRSEVYSEHLPAIIYRTLQYEKKQDEDPYVFKITLEDRLYIAKDTIEQFKVKHSQGMDLVEQSYQIANKAMLDDEPLLPPILQIGAV
jgi:hypothetical protein